MIFRPIRIYLLFFVTHWFPSWSVSIYHSIKPIDFSVSISNQCSVTTLSSQLFRI